MRKGQKITRDIVCLATGPLAATLASSDHQQSTCVNSQPQIPTSGFLVHKAGDPM